MITPASPENESFRIKELQDLKILDTLAEERFNRIVRVAKSFFQIPIVAITLVDTNRQWFKSYCGLDVSETSRNVSFCGHAIHHDDVMVVKDALLDERFVDNPLVVNKPNIRFYAGMPFSSINGAKLGTLCIIDSKPREYTEEQIQVLKDLAKWVELEINTTLLWDSFYKTKENLDKIKSMNSIMVDRELRMVELKEEIARLKAGLK